MGKFLLMTDFYHYNPSANGICIEKLANELYKQGHQVSVLAYGTRGEEEYELINGIHVYRVLVPWFYEIRERNKGQGYMHILFQLFRVLRLVRIVLFLPIYPLIYPWFAMKYFYKSESIVKEKKIESVIAEYIPIEAIYAGLRLKRKYPNIFFQSYIVDTFTQSPNALNYRIIGNVSKQWEKKIIEASDSYYYINNYKHYYAKAEFDACSYKMYSVGFPLVEDRTVPLRYRGDEINFLYTGSWGGERNPEDILNEMSKITEFGKLSFRYCGKLNSTAMSIKNRFHFVVLEGFVQQDELTKVYANTDVLISLGNSSNMIPSKLFSYISTGLPILHFYLVEKDPCVKLLQNYKHSRCLPLSRVNTEDLRRSIAEILDQRQDFTEIRKNYEEYTPEFIANKMTLIK